MVKKISRSARQKNERILDSILAKYGETRSISIDGCKSRVKVKTTEDGMYEVLGSGLDDVQDVQHYHWNEVHSIISDMNIRLDRCIIWVFGPPSGSWIARMYLPDKWETI